MSEQVEPDPDTYPYVDVDVDVDVVPVPVTYDVTPTVTHDPTHPVADDVPALPIFHEPDMRGQRSMLVTAGVATGILVLTWGLTSLVPDHITGGAATGVGGFWNLALSIITFLIWAAGIFAAGFILLLGANEWGQSRVKNARAARGETDPQPQGTPPFALVLVGGAVAYIGIAYTVGIIQGALLLLGAAVTLLGILRIALNLFAPNSQ